MAITWNIESLKKNIFFLKEVVETRRPSLVMLSEPQTHQADVAPIMDYLAGDFCYYLNSEDLHHQELPLVSNHAVGGTMCLWSRSLDPYVTVHPTPTSAFTTIILAIPNYMISIHITIYLPTHGKDVEFLADMAELRICLADLCHQFPDAAIYIRGDGNVNLKNRKRVILLENFIADFGLKQISVGHQTYHHFLGEGAFDSSLDIILHTSSVQSETIAEIICKLENPAVLSHHDLIISNFFLPFQPCPPRKEQNLVTAPKLELKRSKIYWNEGGAAQYEQLVTPRLQQIRQNWLKPDSLPSISILLKLTNTVLSDTASLTNDSKVLNSHTTRDSKRTPKPIIKAKRKLYRIHRKIRVVADETPLHLKAIYRQAKQE